MEPTRQLSPAVMSPRRAAQAAALAGSAAGVGSSAGLLAEWRHDSDGPPERPYRFFFFAGGRDEPPHVHVQREAKRAKFWLDPVRLQNSGGFDPPEINRVEPTARDHPLTRRG